MLQLLTASSFTAVLPRQGACPSKGCTCGMQQLVSEGSRLTKARRPVCQW